MVLAAVDEAGCRGQGCLDALTQTWGVSPNFTRRGAIQITVRLAGHVAAGVHGQVYVNREGIPLRS